MASITITFDHPQASFTRTINLADADLVRLVQACKSKFYVPPSVIGPGPEMQGDQQPLTNRQALERLVQATWGEYRRIVRAFEEQQVIEAARATVGTIQET